MAKAFTERKSTMREAKRILENMVIERSGRQRRYQAWSRRGRREELE